jgi:PDDEXK-like domain of unknown function (DUF3799)
MPTEYAQVPEGDYRSWPEMSQSMLKHGRKSMAHLRHAIDTGEQVETDSMRAGSAWHIAVLEPETFRDRVACWDGVRRGKAWDEFEAECLQSKRITLTRTQYDTIRAAAKAVQACPFASQYFSAVEYTERSARGMFGGIPFKARADAITAERCIIDLKLTRSTDPVTYIRSAIAFGYHIQAAVYLDLFRASRFIMLACESSAPYDCVPFEFAPALIRQGREEALSLCAQYSRCVETGVWPGRSSDIVAIEMPEYMADRSGSEITIDGEQVFSD